MSNLGEMVEEMESDYENLKVEMRNLEEQMDDLDVQLEDATNELHKLQAFKDWVALAYPVVVKDYESVKLIEEVANGI
jgi:predicted  nucleic acid-binding Zn-ribbon protein